MRDEFNTGPVTLWKGEPDKAPSWGEVFEASRRDVETSRTLVMRAAQREAAYDARNDAIFKATGERLFNPLRLDPVEAMRRAAEAKEAGAFHRVAFFDDLDEAGYQRRLKALAGRHPQHADTIGAERSIESEGHIIARQRADRASQALEDYRGPWGTGTVASFAGAFAGSLRDPVQTAGNLLAGGYGIGKNLLRAALYNGASGAAIEAGMAPFIQQWRKEAGLESGFLEAAKDIGVAGATGFGLDLGIRGGWRSAKYGLARAKGEHPSARDMILEGKSPQDLLREAAAKRPEGDLVRRAVVDGDDAALAELARELPDLDAPTRGALSEVERNILFDAPRGVDKGEHISRLAEAMERSLNPHAPPAGDAVRIPEHAAPDLSNERAVKVGETLTIEGRPVSFALLDPKRLEADAGRLELDPASSAVIRSPLWDPVAAGKAVVFEAADGRMIVVDGHRRLDLAQRLGSQGQDARMHAYVFREADGWEIADARAYAGIKNLKELSKSPLDMAAVMRARPDLVDASLPLSTGKLKQAAALARLSDEAFGMVASGRLKPQHAVVIGDLVSDKSLHAPIAQEMARHDVRSVQQARLLLGDILARPRADAPPSPILGGWTRPETIPARVEVLDKAVTILKGDKRIFSLLEREAERIEAAGNILNPIENLTRASRAERLIGLVERLAGREGPVAEALADAARAVDAGIKPRTAAEAFARRIGDILEKEGVEGLLRPPARPVRPGLDDPFGAEAKAQTERLQSELLPKSEEGSAAALGDGQRLTRAEEMGFDTSMVWYHGTRTTFDAFDETRGGGGIWLTLNKDQAEAFGDPGGYYIRADKFGTMMDYLKARQAAVASGHDPGSPQFARAMLDRLKAAGFDGIRDPRFKGAGGSGDEVVMLLDPRNVRSVNAAFDPEQSGSANLMSAAGPSPAWKAFDFAVKSGRVATVKPEVVAAGHRALASVMPAVPKEVPVGMLAKVEPIKGQKGTVRLVFAAADGNEFYVALPWDRVSSYRAFYLPPGFGGVAKFPGAIGFLRVESGGLFEQSLRGELWHELVHLFRRRGETEQAAWGRLVAHAERLRVLDSEVGTYMAMIGRTDLTHAKGDVRSLRSVYEVDYSTRTDAKEMLDQENVAHLMERLHHGELLPAEVAPVAADIKALFGAVLATKGRMAANDTVAAAIAGPLSKRANVKKLEEAQALEAAGLDYFAIRQKTGWERGADGGWRFEFGDADARLKPEAADAIRGKAEASVTGAIEDVLDHPVLFEAYPKLKGYELKLHRIEEGIERGTIDTNKRRIEVWAWSLSGALRKIMHEVQHGIQKIEGWATGGSAEARHAVRKAAIDGIDAEAAALVDRLDAVVRETSPIAELIGGPNPEIGRLQDRLAKLVAERQRIEGEAISALIDRLAGEVEARNVERRLGMSRGERMASSLRRTEDMDRGDQVLVHNIAKQASEDWEEDAFRQLASRSFAIDLATWERKGGRGARGARGDRSALEVKAEKLLKDVQAEERRLREAGETAEEIAAALNAKFGTEIEPAQIAQGMAWWSVASRVGEKQVRWTERNVAELQRLADLHIKPNMKRGKIQAAQATIAKELAAFTGVPVSESAVSQQLRLRGLRKASDINVSRLVTSPEVVAQIKAMAAEANVAGSGSRPFADQQLLREAMARTGLRPAQLARRIGGHQSVYSNVMAGKRGLPRDEAEAMARLAGLPPPAAVPAHISVRIAEALSKQHGVDIPVEHVRMVMSRIVRGKREAASPAWPDEALALLTSEQVAGLSYREIAQLLSDVTGSVYTRGNVAGKLGRLRQQKRLEVALEAEKRPGELGDVVEACKK